MKFLVWRLSIVTGFFLLFFNQGMSQEVKCSNAKTWDLSGRVQVQHLWDKDIESDAAVTNNGFRIRRGRFQVKSTLSDRVSATFQMEVRDNSPRILDAEGKLKVFGGQFFRLGQFKVPVWREELRSSGKLLLIERSAVAEFLVENYLSARQIGVEFGGKLFNKVEFAVNYSNGAGEGGREDAGRKKFSSDYDSLTINNGKLYTARINIPLAEAFQLGVSGVLNQRGNEVSAIGFDKMGNVTAIAPDFGIYLPVGFDVEGGVVLGSISKNLSGLTDNQDFFLFDVTGRIKSNLKNPVVSLAGLDAWEFAAGFSYVEPDKDLKDDELQVIRFGPAVYFGKHARVQVNGEIEDNAISDATFKVRSQLTINF